MIEDRLATMVASVDKLRIVPELCKLQGLLLSRNLCLVGIYCLLGVQRGLGHPNCLQTVLVWKSHLVVVTVIFWQLYLASGLALPLHVIFHLQRSSVILQLAINARFIFDLDSFEILKPWH